MSFSAIRAAMSEMSPNGCAPSSPGRAGRRRSSSRPTTCPRRERISEVTRCRATTPVPTTRMRRSLRAARDATALAAAAAADAPVPAASAASGVTANPAAWASRATAIPVPSAEPANPRPAPSDDGLIRRRLRPASDPTPATTAGTRASRTAAIPFSSVVSRSSAHDTSAAASASRDAVAPRERTGPTSAGARASSSRAPTRWTP